MQLDKTQIVIRERTFVDILDLSLRVVRAYAGPLCLAFLAGIVPFFLLNAWLLSGFAGTDLEVEFDPTYGYWLVVLVLWELPLATAPATLFLGRVLFQQEPLPGKDAAAGITRGLWRSAPQLFFYQVLVRPLLVVPIFTWLWLFSARPYLNEVILLERNPFRQRSAEQPSTGRRVRALHSARSGRFVWPVVCGHGRRRHSIRRFFQFDLVFARDAFRRLGKGGPDTVLFSFRSLAGCRVFHGGSIPELPRPANPPRGLGGRAFVAKRIQPSDKKHNNDLTAMNRSVPKILLCLILGQALLNATAFANMPAPAAEDPSVEAGREALGHWGRYPWYDAENDAIERIDVAPPEVGFWEWLWNLLPDFNWPSGAGSAGSTSGGLLQTLAYGLIAAVALVLVFFLVRGFSQAKPA